MILRIDNLRPTQEFAFDVDSQACEMPTNLGTFQTPIHFDAFVRKIETEITIAGHFTVDLEMACARCLRPHTEHLDESFEVIYYPVPAKQTPADEAELHATDLDVGYYDGETLSLLDVLREQLLIGLPVQPLCQANCAGLCPSCGQDLNDGPCGCQRAAGDPRFAVLAQLFQATSN